MHQYDKVLSYIDYLSTATEEVGTWVHKPHILPYVNYSQELSSFIHEVYQTDLMDTEYLTYLESHLPRDAKLADYIDTADFRLLRAILTYYVRQERFCEGLWLEAVRDRIFSKILNRLLQILKQDTL
ncbi:MAG TPA: DUF6508 domain-containing protein [Candidatus Cloacimonadota bacterium]|nr:DUF6508 domain-containing protein [Candidatus Cloacimonadota bacterium]HOD18076.1 DUF6508 domain-containing protein [Candidatus Cloacimonadota bacterium]HQL15069.1 DUF6508 domain-containing protein [Candidatus Cloacimonadota bacterium]HQL15072.1 DUF6508 domain-containing protein [Candidatus Cloacimonadota bacterium]